MGYNSFYGLTFNPFDKQQLKEKDCFRSKDFNEMNVRLNHLKNIRGIGVFTALPGMGKSYALRCFAKSLNPNQYHIGWCMSGERSHYCISLFVRSAYNFTKCFQSGF